MGWPSTESLDSLINNITKDLKPFSVLGEVDIKGPRRTGFEAKFETNKGIVISAEFRIDKDGMIIVEPGGHSKSISYRAFLASELLGDLNRLGEMITKTVSNPQDLPYIESEAVLGTENDGTPYIKDDATRVISDALSEVYLGRTNLVFLKAPAGCGKTYTLRKLTREQAGKYVSGNATDAGKDFLYIYIDAQGKALTNLEEIFARVLDDLGARLSYKVVSVLTRNSLIVPVIDGFDELIGSGGYAEAFKSLSNFLAFAEGSGAILAAGRSSFYDNEVWRNATGFYKSSDTYNYELTSIELKTWSEVKTKEYFSKYFEGNQDLLDEANYYLDRTNASNKGVLSKPFYTAEFAKYIKEVGGPIDPDKEILDFLVRGFVDREAGKFKNRQGERILSLDQHLTLLKYWAEEMWWLEKRDLDIDTMLVYVESSAETWRIRPEDEAIITGKIPSYALFKLVPGETEKTYAFEHDEYYEYFLLSCFQGYLRSTDPDLVTFLNRSLLSDSFLFRFGLLLEEIEVGVKLDWYGKIACATRPARHPSNLSTNAGLLTCKLLDNAYDLPSGLLLRNLDIPVGKINNVILDGIQVLNCNIGDLDIAGTKLLDAVINNTYIRLLRMDEISRLEGTNIVPGRDVEAVFDAETREEIRNPLRMAEYLASKGAEVGQYLRRIKEAPLLTDRQESIIGLLHKFLTHAKRSYFFSIGRDPGFSSLRRDRFWPETENLLRESGLLVDKNRAGVEYPLQHLTQPFDIILAGQNREKRGLPVSVIDFWDNLYSLAESR